MPEHQLSARPGQTTTELAVSGLVPLTTNDFPGCLAAVVFCQGCPWRCRYCHNPHLQPRTKGLYEWNDIQQFLSRRIGLLDAVVFSGGEPTAQEEALCYTASKVDDMGFRVGLHTAGCYPEGIKRLLPLLDWVGLDIKALPDDYPQVTGIRNSALPAYQSLKLLLDAGINLEVRTTVSGRLTNEQNLLALARLLADMGVKNFAVQHFRKVGCNDNELNNIPKINLGQPAIETMRRMFSSFVCRG
jgi:pyruvate formate lyase activating enzyme